jgi:hypothetical protein
MAEARVKYQGSPCGISGEQSDGYAALSPSISLYLSLLTLYHKILSPLGSRAGRIGKFVAVVLRN